MVKSLRWKLLAWYAVVLSCLGCVFGALLYANLRRSMERDMDVSLRSQATSLADVIFPAGGGKYHIDLSPEQVEYFGQEGEGSSYFAIWRHDGAAVDSSHPSRDIPIPRGRGSRNRGDYRELSVRGPADTWVLVGKDVRRERQQLRSSTAAAFGAGLVAMTLMLAGGWFFTSRALAPIERISRAASAISASNLSERIDATRMETELAELAGTINDAFARLEQAFEQQNRFTADASHELRTPLSIILAQAEFALRREPSTAEYRETLIAIRRASQRMRKIVEGLLTLARADADRIHLHKKHFDFRQLIEETCSMFRPVAAEQRITMIERLEPALMVGDRDRLAEAVANLLANSVQYNHPGGRVEVTLMSTGDQAELRIADTGPGIPDHERPHIFERFYRVDKARSRSVDGSGLGLAITKWIIDAHGGSISCAGGSQGGTMFVVRLTTSSNGLG